MVLHITIRKIMGWLSCSLAMRVYLIVVILQTATLHTHAYYRLKTNRKN